MALNFVEAYRTADPAAARDVVAAREVAFKVIRPEVTTMTRVFSLCRLAFCLSENPAELQDWFEAPIRDADSHFVLSQDRADAGRMAAIVLRDVIEGSSDAVALAVLAASFSGKREALDLGDLVESARKAIAESARRPNIFVEATDLEFPSKGNWETNLAALDSGLTPASVKTAVKDLRSQSKEALAAINRTNQKFRKDGRTLADEVDILWWYIGECSNELELPRKSLAAKALPLVIGIDLGGLVRDLPGPYGVYGIIRKTLSSSAEKLLTAEECIGALEPAQISKLAPANASELFPLHLALGLATGGGDWKAVFRSQCADVVGLKLSHNEIATQAFRDRVCMKYAGLLK